MKLDTPIGLFTAHFHIPPASACSPWRLGGDVKRVVAASLHRGASCLRDPQGPGDPGGCRADSGAWAEITCARRRPFRRDALRAAALAKCMGRLGLNKNERLHLWLAYFAQVNVIPRRCVAVVTTCPAGHRHRVEAITPNTITGFGAVYFGSAREFCGARVDFGHKACEQPTIEAKHRYLYAVDLPEGARAKRRRLVRERLAKLPSVDTSAADISF